MQSLGFAENVGSHLEPWSLAERVLADVDALG